MNVISFKSIRAFSSKHPDAEVALRAWYTTAKRAIWHNLAELKCVYPSADLVGRYTVFNIRGNSDCLISRIVYKTRTVFIVGIMTHKEYDKEKWKT
jgi:mRNA interferase HigB